MIIKYSCLHRKANEALWLRTSPVSDIDSSDAGLTFTGDFPALLTDFYRLEYIYSSLKNKPFSGVETRKNNILRKVTAVFSQVTDELRYLLKLVFEDWLGSHALTDPDKWAYARYQSLSEQGDSLEAIWSSVLHEYCRYKDMVEGEGWAAPRAENFILRKMAQSDKGKEILISLFGGEEAFVEETVAITMSDYEYDPVEVTERLGLPEDASEDEVREAAEIEAKESIDVVNALDAISDISFQFNNFIGEAEDLIIYVNKHFVFPLWFAYWQPKGIEKTRDNIQKIYEALANENNLDKKYAIVNMAINATHQNGSILEYVEPIVNASESLTQVLNELSNGSFIYELNPILQEAGVQI